MECARLTGCGTQHPHCALGGTCVLLAAAPTTPPCFRHWRRSSSLLCASIAERIFLFAVPKRLRALRNYFFTGRGRRGKRQNQRGFVLRQASSPSPSLLRKSTSPKGRGLGKEMKFAWTAKGSPFGRAGALAPERARVLPIEAHVQRKQTLLLPVSRCKKTSRAAHRLPDFGRMIFLCSLIPAPALCRRMPDRTRRGPRGCQ